MATRTVVELTTSADAANLRNALLGVQRVVEGALTRGDPINIERVVTSGVVSALRVTFDDTNIPDEEILACLRGFANLVAKPASGIAAGITTTLGFDSVGNLQRSYSV